MDAQELIQVKREKTDSLLKAKKQIKKSPLKAKKEKRPHIKGGL